ncbi:MAG: UvrD-helicase domain-containing protein [Prevotella sp.]|nr:UvrD-helicase domain-containing protein [Prevotella sp.]
MNNLINNEWTAPLKVYKASAGSGKTFTLAAEYIKLLIDNPMRYRQILAVTFTNKATEEMKQRVLSQLYGIWKGYEDSQSYLRKICEELQMDEQLVRERAQKALELLLHNYSYLRVETIDSFFQSVLRNLARELDLNANLRISLNDKDIEQRAVDEMIENLRRGSEELTWILSYIQDSISDDKSWDVIGQIKGFGENLFKDQYKENSQRLGEILSQPQFFEEYTKTLQALRTQAQEQLAGYGKEFFERLNENGLSETDLSGGSRSISSYFRKLANCETDEKKYLTATLAKCLESPEAWVTKKNAVPGNTAYDLVCNQLFGLLHEAEESRAKLICQMKSAALTLRHLDQLRLLRSIERTMRESDKEAGRFMLSNTQLLLNRLIADNDTPFIFEKMGTRFRHIMIDEFQDTSGTQWKNFMVLLKECMSYGAVGNDERKMVSNLIVGDVKQSIYRWRGGDWRMLNNIVDDFQKEQVFTQPMSTNWRSYPNIIRFNNAFFKTAAELERLNISQNNPEGSRQLQAAYSYGEMRQLVSPKNKTKGGFVNIELFSEKTEPEENILPRTAETIDNLLAAGVRPKDIAILVRKNSYIQQIADYLSKERPQLELVSDEAFRLDASVAVNMIVDALRWLNEPTDDLALSRITFYQQRYIAGDEQYTSNRLAEEKVKAMLTTEAHRLRRLPITDLVEELCMLFHVDLLQEEGAYLSAFNDQLSKFLTEYTADLKDFLTAWDDSIGSKTIHGNDVNGIRLITIHKSKGLEYDHVILPFCDWKLEQRYTIWCAPRETPYDRLPLVPIDFTSKQMQGTIYEADYEQEHLQNVIDNMNLLYVAFTRAKKSLFVFGKRGSSAARSQLIEQCLPVLPDVFADEERADKVSQEKTATCIFNDNGGEKDSTLSLTIGTPVAEENEGGVEEEETGNIFLQKPKQVNVPFTTHKGFRRFRQSNQSKRYVEERADGERDYVTMGSVLHDIFSHIRTTTDIRPALAELEQNGVLYDENISREKLITMLRKRLENPLVADWFSPRWTLFNECTILSRDELTGLVKERRPDRVMTDGKEMVVVDFKFAKEDEEHVSQVRKYMDLLRQMGHQNVKGFLWYVYRNEIKPVIDDEQ